jgi:hypothetical protein
MKRKRRIPYREMHWEMRERLDEELKWGANQYEEEYTRFHIDYGATQSKYADRFFFAAYTHEQVA